jgi:glutaredoxin
MSPMTLIEPASSQEEESSTEVIKSDKPTVELFVMTHCPYGTQAEKGFIPAIKNLGSSIDAQVRFVHYFMHGDTEEAETYNQVCIREEQSAKYLDYLTCFLEDGNTTRCIKKVGIDQAKVNKCVSSGKAKEYYSFDSQLSEGYGVQGSPTLVINGVQISSGRDAASMLDSICGTFNNAPSTCGASLSSTSPSPGFGTGTTSGSTSAQC